VQGYWWLKGDIRHDTIRPPGSAIAAVTSGPLTKHRYSDTSITGWPLFWFSEPAHGLRLAFASATALGVQKIASVGLKEGHLCLDEEETLL
jgi:hypothetical protein